MRRCEGERLSYDGATARGRDWDLRVWGFESDFWERQRRVRVESDWEMRKGFKRVILREGRTTPYRREKKICWSCFRTTSFRDKKKKKISWATSFKGWKSQNRLNQSRFTELDGRTAVWTVPCFFCMERFLTLNRPWIWTVHGFSGLTVRSGPGSITLGLR